MKLDAGQKFEKAVQHAISYAHYVAKNECNEGADTCDVLVAAAARVYRLKHGTGQPDEWLANSFAQYFRDALLEGA
jgi:hypothetical protein